MINKNFKSGFTLVELMVFFVFISILLAASTPLITKRVENVPLRAFHGKYMCYRDADTGMLVEEYYNSAGRETNRIVHPLGDNEVTFTPPKKAAIFKVEMVGAGAGGYDYVNYSTESNPQHQSWFNKEGDGEFEGELAYKPLDSDIKELLQGQTNTISIYTGDGGDGGQLTYQYFDPAITYCNRSTLIETGDGGTTKAYHYYNPGDVDKSVYKEAGEDNINTFDIVNANEETLRTKIDALDVLKPMKDESDKTFSRTYVTSAHYALLDGLCKDCNLDGYWQSKRVPKARRDGGKGGKGQYLTFSYKIDFNNAGSRSAADFIKYLMSYYQGGSCSTAGCSGSAFAPGSYPKSGDNGDSAKMTAYSELSAPPAVGAAGHSSEAGEDASAYAAIKLGNRYITNNQKATGGTGVTMYVEANTGLLKYDVNDGKDADGYAGAVDAYGNITAGGPGGDPSLGYGSTDTSSFKYIYLYSTVPTRTYYIGASGNNGEYKTHQLPRLGESCRITIPPLNQSNTVTPSTDVEDLNIMNTSFICEGWRNPLIARSGEPEKLCQNRDGDRVSCNPLSSANRYPIYNPYANPQYNPDGTIRFPEKYEVEQQIPAILSFGSAGGIFTKALNNLGDYGKGGNGTGYTDLCTKVGGQVRLTVSNSTRSKDIIYEPEACSMSNNPTENASSGKPGAVIVSW